MPKIKQVILKIADCRECPNHIGYVNRCGHPTFKFGKVIPRTDVYQEIPKWCPLQDEKNKQKCSLCGDRERGVPAKDGGWTTCPKCKGNKIPNKLTAKVLSDSEQGIG